MFVAGAVLADALNQGYLPAEHIETPTERLARLNKHRNIDVGSKGTVFPNSGLTHAVVGNYAG